MSTIDYHSRDAQPRRGRLWRPLKIAAVVVASVLFAGLVATAWIAYTIKTALDPVTDPAKYQMALSEQQGCQYLGHFPASIPATATGVQFFYQRPFLQGGLNLFVRYKLLPSQIRAIEQRFASQPTTLPSDPLFMPFLAGQELPPSFRIVFFNTSGGGNHGHELGVAVDVLANEVVYWAVVY